MGQLTGNSAIVTGGAQGIGFGIVVELVRAGCRVVIGDRDVQLANQAVANVESQTEAGTVIALPLDVSDSSSVEHCVAGAIDRFSKIDILVNNAGIHCERIGEISSVEQFYRCFEVNLFGAWRMAQALVPHFKRHGTGKIINVASINGRKPWADTPAYSASKAALINLTQSLAMRLGAENINVNAVCPGGVRTAMAEIFVDALPGIEDGMIRERVLKRAILPEDIGHAVVFLASVQSRNITGQALNVDGGVLMN